jgi:hypothetical protein
MERRAGKPVNRVRTPRVLPVPPSSAVRQAPDSALGLFHAACRRSVWLIYHREEVSDRIPRPFYFSGMASGAIRAVKFMAAPGIGFVEAVELIQAHRGGSEYTAQVVLGNAIASCKHPLVVEPGYEVMLIEDKRFNRDALLAYLNRHYPAVAKPKQAPKQAPKRKEQKKQNRAKEAVGKLWPNGVPSPENLPNKALCNEVLAWLRKDCIERKLPMVRISNRTILRAADRA